jgi:hypothetical protein
LRSWQFDARDGFGLSRKQAGSSDYSPARSRSAAIWPFLAAAKVLPLARVAALRECSLIFGTVIGTVLLNEPFGARRFAAAGLVTSGVIVLATSARH